MRYKGRRLSSRANYVNLLPVGGGSISVRNRNRTRCMLHHIVSTYQPKFIQFSRSIIKLPYLRCLEAVQECVLALWTSKISMATETLINYTHKYNGETWITKYDNRNVRIHYSFIFRTCEPFLIVYMHFPCALKAEWLISDMIYKIYHLK